MTILRFFQFWHNEISNRNIEVELTFGSLGSLSDYLTLDVAPNKTIILISFTKVCLWKCLFLLFFFGVSLLIASSSSVLPTVWWWSIIFIFSFCLDRTAILHETLELLWEIFLSIGWGETDSSYCHSSSCPQLCRKICKI